MKSKVSPDMMVLRMRLSGIPPFVEKKKHFHRVDDYMSSQEPWHELESKAVTSSSTPLLHHPDSLLDVRDVFICRGHIY